MTLLKTRRITAAAIRELRRVAPIRQNKMAERMVAANNPTTLSSLATQRDGRMPIAWVTGEKVRAWVRPALDRYVTPDFAMKY